MKSLSDENNFDCICPSCDSSEIKYLGIIPSSNYFAGVLLPSALPGGNLYKCLNCELCFRHPRLKHYDMNALYRDASSSQWQYKAGSRRDWNLAENWLKGCICGNILDVGCWDGSFLLNLPAQWEKFGIEINEQAVTRAKAAGIKIIGNNLYELNNLRENYFDVVVAFDIIEHMEDPAAFLSLILKFIRPRGYVLIGTGNTDARTWKLAKSRYWYCWLPEHISFVNLAWFTRLVKEQPFLINSIVEYAHHSQPSIVGLILQSLINYLYLFTPSLFSKIRLWRWKVLGKPQYNIDHPPVWDMSNDHFLAILQKV